MKGIKKVLLTLLLILIGLQFIQPVRNKSGQAMPNEITKTMVVPEPVLGILKRACYDCHSNHTDYPWYATIQPIHWYLNQHIQDGKAVLNFSEFGSYTPRKQRNKLNAIKNSIKDDAMPLSSYMLVHRNAVLNAEEKSLLISWLEESQL